MHCRGAQTQGAGHPRPEYPSFGATRIPTRHEPENKMLPLSQDRTRDSIHACGGDYSPDCVGGEQRVGATGDRPRAGGRF